MTEFRISYDTAQDHSYTEHTTKWLGTVIAKKHSFLKTIDEIIAHQLENEVSTVGLQGREGTGKSTLARIIAHQIHTEMSKKATSNEIPAETREKLKRGYSVHFLSDQHLIHFQETLDAMPNSNRIIIFDDVSFLTGKASKKEMDHLKNAFTTIRHTAGGEDVKTVIIFCFHYSRGLDIYLRDTVVKYFTSIRPEESKIIQSMIGGSDMAKIKLFQKKYSDFSLGKPIKFPLGKKRSKSHRWVIYNYGKPFRLAAYYNNSGVSLCVYPKAEALVPKDCKICNSKISSVKIDYEDLVNWLMKQYGQTAVRTAIRYIAIRRYGTPLNYKNIKYANECLNRLRNNGVIDIDDFLEKQIADPHGALNFKTQQHKNYIELPYDVTEGFLHRFGIDGLHAPTQTTKIQSKVQSLKEIEEAEKNATPKADQ